MSDFASTSRFTETGIYVSEAKRLQQVTDRFTRKYEHERKRFMILDDQLKQALKEKKQKEKEISEPVQVSIIKLQSITQLIFYITTVYAFYNFYANPLIVYLGS